MRTATSKQFIPFFQSLKSTAVLWPKGAAFASKAQAFSQLILPGSLGKTNLVWSFNSNYTGSLSKNEN